MSTLEDVQGLYEAYQDQARALERASKPWERLFGLVGGPQSHPCHEQFIQSLEQTLRAAADRPLPAVEAAALLDYIYFPAPARRRSQDSSCWMRVAVHGLTLDLIPLLRPEDARALRGRYQGDYPRRSRLPVQEKVLDALKRRGENL